jgi:hypothetical protein
MTSASNSQAKETRLRMHNRGNHPILVMVVAAAYLAALAVAASPGLALAAPTTCDTPTSNYFAGLTTNVDTVDAQGVRVQVDYKPVKPCTQVGGSLPSWILTWVGFEGVVLGGPYGVNIYQGGYATCGPSCGYNGGKPYYWYFYGHETGACGMAANSGFVKVRGNVPAGASDSLKVALGGDGDYHFYVNGTPYDSRTISELNICWAEGIKNADWVNEMLNFGDQNGGSDAARQVWTDAQYRTGSSTWNDIDRPLGGYCEHNSSPVDWGCRIKWDDHNSFRNWDARY